LLNNKKINEAVIADKKTLHKENDKLMNNKNKLFMENKNYVI